MSDAFDRRIQAFIRANLPIGPVPSVPEVRLHRAGPASGLWRLAQHDDAFDTPYWAYDWGGGLALARYVLDHPQIVTGRRVLDLGAGSGIVAIAAAKAGAAEVVAADVDRYAIAAIALNAGINDVEVRPLLRDLLAEEPPVVDVVLVGDLFYEPGLAGRVVDFLDRCHGSQVLIGDPGRAFLPRQRLNLRADYPGLDFGGQGGRNAVFAFRPER